MIGAGMHSAQAQVSGQTIWKVISGAIQPVVSSWTIGSSSNRIAKIWATDLDTSTLTFGGISGNLDMGGYQILNVATTTGTVFVASSATATSTFAGGLTVAKLTSFATTTVSRVMDFTGLTTNPVSPSAGIARIHALTVQGFTRIENDNEAGANVVLGQDNIFIGKNTSGGAVTKGQVVYVVSSVGAIPTLSLAKADSQTTVSPTVGIVTDTSIANNAFGQFMLNGIVDNMDTSAFSQGANIYVSADTAGALTATRPVYPNFAKGIGIVLNSHASQGSILVNVAPFLGGIESGTTATQWTATNVSTTNATSTGKLNIPNGASPSVVTTGDVAIDTTSSQLIGYGTSAKKVYGNGNIYAGFTYATSTAWTATSTIPLGTARVGETWNDVQCYTDTGTLNVSFNDGTNRMDMLNASTTVGTVTFTTNNTFTSAEKRYVDVGTPASSPTKISCTVSRSIMAD